MVHINSSQASAPKSQDAEEIASPKMDPVLKAKWIEALRSGEYQQTFGALRDNDGHCCLGVLCEVSGLKIIGRNKIEGVKLSDQSDYQPILDLIGRENPFEFTIRNDGGDLSPRLDGSGVVTSHSFSEIADYIEASL
jgi:hypothetical protein